MVRRFTMWAAALLCVSASVAVGASVAGAGLANATLQQRLVPVRLLYDFLIEERRWCIAAIREFSCKLSAMLAVL